MGVIDDRRIQSGPNSVIKYCKDFLIELRDEPEKHGIKPVIYTFHDIDLENCSSLSNNVISREQIGRSGFLFTRTDYEYKVTLLPILVNEAGGQFLSLRLSWGALIGWKDKKFYSENHASSLDEIARFITASLQYNQDAVEECLYSAIDHKPWGQSEIESYFSGRRTNISVAGENNTVSGRDINY